MLIVIRNLIPCFRLLRIVFCQCFIEQFVIYFLNIFIAEDHVLRRPFSVHVDGMESSVVVPDAAFSHHTGNGYFYKIHVLSVGDVKRSVCFHRCVFSLWGTISTILLYHRKTRLSTSLLLSGEKVTQKHFHTTGNRLTTSCRQYESAMRSPRGLRGCRIGRLHFLRFRFRFISGSTFVQSCWGHSPRRLRTSPPMPIPFHILNQ